MKRMFIHKIYKILIILFLTKSFAAKAGDDWHYAAHFNFGCTFTMNWGCQQQFPGVRLFTAFGINASYRQNVITNYAISLSVYSKTIGANLNPLYHDVQLDLVNSFSIGYGSEWGSYSKGFRTLNNAPYQSIVLRNKYAGILTSNWVINSDRRNQVVGSISGSFPGMTINYSNDGAVPFTILPLADLFDRWWTGGGAVYAHSRKGFNIVELGFDQFTGYSPLLYELSGILGIDIPPYNWDPLKSNKKKTYNTSAYYLRINTDTGFGLETGITGSLRSADGKKIYAVQDLIHYLSGYPLHPNHDDTKFYLGGLYNNLRNVPVEN